MRREYRGQGSGDRKIGCAALRGRDLSDLTGGAG